MNLYKVSIRDSWSGSPVYVVASSCGEAESKAMDADSPPDDAREFWRCESVELIGPADRCLRP